MALLSSFPPQLDSMPAKTVCLALQGLTLMGVVASRPIDMLLARLATLAASTQTVRVRSAMVALWAAARLHVPDADRKLTPLTNALLHQLPLANPIELSIALWAARQLRITFTPTELDEFADHFVNKIDDTTTTQTISIFVSAMA